MATDFLSHGLVEEIPERETPGGGETLHGAGPEQLPDELRYGNAAEVAALLSNAPNRDALILWLQQHRTNTFVQEVLAEPALGTQEPEQLGFRPWPVNGRVINNSKRPVKVWSDSKGEYEIPPGESSGIFLEDVDHVQDASGQWWKIGANTVTIDEDGNVHNAKCATEMGQDCPS